jgi:transposase
MELFWLTDPQWGRIEPLLPKVHTGPPFQFRYNNRHNPDIFGAAIKGC